MLAAIYHGVKDITVEEIDKPKINHNEVLIRIKAASICGTDRKIYEYGHFKIKENTEVVLGHEISGVIDEVGQDVHKYKKGMHVVVAPNVGCGECEICKNGFDQLCPDFNAFGVTRPGGFAEYMKVTEDAVRNGNIIAIGDELSFEDGALLEPFSCCYNAWEAMRIQPGDNVLIVGAGPMGNLHLLLNKNLGSGKVFMTDISEERLSFSEKLGADYIFLNDQNLKQNILMRTNGYGVNAVIVATPISAIQNQALDLVGIKGSVSFFAGLPKGVDYANLKTNLIHYKQLRVTGTTGSSLGQFRKTVKIVKSLGIKLDRIVTKTIGINQLPKLFEDHVTFNKNMKVIVNPEIHDRVEACK